MIREKKELADRNFSICIVVYITFGGTTGACNGSINKSACI